MSLGETRFEDLTLARLDSREGDAHLREEVAALLPADGAVRVSAAYEGADAADAVWVSVNARAVVEEVTVSRQWAQRLEPAEVGEALLTSYRDAVQKAYSAAALVAFQQRSRDEEPARPIGTDSGSRPGDDDRQWLSGVREALEEIDADMRRQARIRAEADASVRTVVSPSGLVTVTVAGHAVTRVTAEVRLVRSASGEQLGREALAAFRAAQQAGERGDGDRFAG